MNKEMIPKVNDMVSLINLINFELKKEFFFNDDKFCYSMGIWIYSDNLVSWSVLSAKIFNLIEEDGFYGDIYSLVMDE